MKYIVLTTKDHEWLLPVGFEADRLESIGEWMDLQPRSIRGDRQPVQTID